MKLQFGGLALVLSVSTAVAQTPCRNISDIGWIAGIWQQQTDQATTVETWQPLSGDIMTGNVSTTRADGHPGFSESILLAQMEGQVFYITKVRENPRPVAFTAVDCEPGTVSFVNPEHDFPTKLVYARSQEDMTVTVTGPDEKGFTVRYQLINKQ